MWSSLRTFATVIILIMRQSHMFHSVLQGLTEVGSGEYKETEYFMLPVVSSGGSILYFCRNKALTGNTKVVLLIPNRVKVLTGRHASVMTTR